LPEADESYSRAEYLFDPLSNEFSGVPDYKHELAECLKNHGDLLRIRRRFQKAEQLLDRAVDLYRELAREYLETPEYRQGLARAYHNLGVLHMVQGHNRAAEEAHGRALKVRQQLAKEFPREPAYRQELAYSFGELAIVQVKILQKPEAEKSFNQGIALLAELEKENPQEPAYWGEQIIQLENLIILLSDLERFEDAAKSSLRVVALRKKLADASPTVAANRSEVGQSLHNLAGFLLEQRKRADARKYLREAIREQAKAVALDAQPAYRQRLCLHYLGLIEVAFSTGDHAEAAQAVAELVKAVPAEVADYPRGAALLARCVALAGKDEKLAEGKRKELAKRYGDQALDLLQKAIARGYKDVIYLRDSRDLEPLRSRDDFKKILSDLETRTKRTSH